MPKFGSTTSAGGSSPYLTKLKGVYFKPVRLKNIEVQDGATDFNGNPLQLSLNITYANGEGDNEREGHLFIAGNFADSWNGWVPKLKNVDLLLNNLGVYNGLKEDDLEAAAKAMEVGSFPASFKRRAMNKEFKVLEFPTAKTYTDKDGNLRKSYRTWDVTFKSDEEADDAILTFKKEMKNLKDNGFNVPYDPTELESDSEDSTEEPEDGHTEEDDFPI